MKPVSCDVAQAVQPAADDRRLHRVFTSSHHVARRPGQRTFLAFWKSKRAQAFACRCRQFRLARRPNLFAFGHDFTPQQGRERELSVTDNSQGRAVMRHYGHRSSDSLVNTAQSIELLTGPRIVVAMESIGVKTEKVVAIRQ